MTGFEKTLTDKALGERLRTIAEKEGSWTPAELVALMREAADRLTRCKHAEFRGTRHCGEMSCWNYVGKHAREAL